MWKNNLFQSLRQTPAINPSSTRSFHATAANMTIKTYFECTWTGPEYKVDKDGKITSRDNDIKGELQLSALLH